ncbi:spore germination protein [Paenibacillus sp. J5C2022]|uniref:GerAB/ArcD/ProY family transporter n=1 Tax=Paenibacillus sp. J5C2022 TaxID=2977129 RepID=UPI0021D25747|nr:spore germination protein [Paenibacillus sp. J5C2022]
MQRIGKDQLGVLVVLFLIGSTPLFQLGSSAKQDAWMAMTLAAAAGLLLTAMYLKLQRRVPDAGLADLYKYHLGRWLGGALAFIHAIWLAYESMRNVRDVGELTYMALLDQTPKSVTMLLILLVAGYTASKGVEVFARVAQLLMPIVFISYGIVISLLFASGLVRLDRLKPVLENGFGPVLKAVPDLVAFPFGQMVVMLVIWRYVKERGKIGKTTYRSQTVVSLFLIFMNVLVMCVLGAQLSAVTALPLLHAVQLVSLANFLERLDIVVTILLYIGLYVKITLLLFASATMISEITGWSYRYLLLPIMLIIYGLSFLEPNYTFHIWMGLKVTLKFVPIFQIVLPLLMLCVGIRSKYKRMSDKGAGG